MSDGAISFPILGDFYINPPSYFKIGPLTIHWYGVIIACGFLLAVLYCSKRAKSFGLEGDSVFDVVIYGLPAGIICARAYYVLFYLELFRGKGFLDYIAIWNGGLAIYGGIIGAALTLVVYCAVKKIKLAPFLDLASLGFLIGQSVGRWGNFINREAFGCETDLPWRMGLNNGGVTAYVHPTFLYESLWNLAGFVILHFLSKRRRYDGQTALMYVAWYGVGRAFIEGLRADSLHLFDTGIRVSQLLAGASALAAVVALILNATVIKHSPEDMLINK